MARCPLFAAPVSFKLLSSLPLQAPTRIQVVLLIGTESIAHFWVSNPLVEIARPLESLSAKSLRVRPSPELIFIPASETRHRKTGKDVRRQNVTHVPALDSEGPGAPSAWCRKIIEGHPPPMTVMFPRFFGLPQESLQDGKMKRLLVIAAKVYVALCHESARHSTRELTRTVAQLQELVGGSPNSHAKARAELIRAAWCRSSPTGRKDSFSSYATLRRAYLEGHPPIDKFTSFELKFCAKSECIQSACLSWLHSAG